MENNVVEESLKKQANMKLIVIVIATILVLVGGVYFGYKKFFSPKSLFIKNINKEYKKIENRIDSLLPENKDNKPVLITNNMKFNFDIDDSLVSDASIKSIISEFNKLGVNAQLGVDTNNMEALVKLNALYDNKSLLNVNGYFKDNTAYVMLKDLYSKYIEIPVETTGSFVQMDSLSLADLDKEDMKYLMSKTKDAMLNSLNEKDFKKSIDKVKINGKEVKVTKISYKFSQKNAYEMAQGMLKTLSNDSKYIKILAKMAGTKEKDMESSLAAISAFMGMVDSKDLDKTTIGTLSVYIKGLSGISIETESELSGKTGIYYYYSDDNKVIKFSNNDEDIFNVTISDNTAKVLINYDDQKIKLNVKKSEKGKTTIYNYTLETEDTKLKGKLTKETVKENNDGTGEYKITASASTMGINIKFTSNLKVEYKDKLNIPDISNSIELEDMDEKDYEEIYFNLLKNSAILSLIQNFIPNGMNMY